MLHHSLLLYGSDKSLLINYDRVGENHANEKLKALL